MVDLDVFPATSEKFEFLVDAIIGWNNHVWDGRRNPLIFHKGNEVSEEDWEVLANVDPDLVVSFSPLSDSLSRSIQDKIGPYAFIERPFAGDGNEGSMPLGIDEGIFVLPTAQNLAKLRVGPFPNLEPPERLLLFEFTIDCPPLLKRFVRRNFGTYYQWIDPKTGKIGRVGWFENLIPTIQVERMLVSDVDSLCEGIRRLSGNWQKGAFRQPVPFVAPAQLCGVGTFDDVAASNDRNYFVVIGDGPDAIREYWNTIAWRGFASRTYARQLWLPNALAQESSIRQALHEWFRRWTGYGSGGSRVELRASESDDGILNDWRNNLITDNLGVPCVVVGPEQVKEQRLQLFRTRSNSQIVCELQHDPSILRFEITPENQRIELRVPDTFVEDGLLAGVWSADVDVERRESFRNSDRNQCWWRVPRRTSSTLIYHMFNAPARIQNSGCFAVRMCIRSDSFRIDTRPHIQIAAPSDEVAVKRLIMPNGKPWKHLSDSRESRIQEPDIIVGCRASEKGIYLMRFLELFGDFLTIEDFCKRWFWKATFRILAGLGADSDDPLHKQITTAIETALKDNAIVNPDSIPTAAKTILRSVRGQLSTKQWTFGDFHKLLSRATQETAKHPREYFSGNAQIQLQGTLDTQSGEVIDATPELKPNEMKDGVDQLLARGILHIGISVACRQCQIQSWFSVETLAREIKCPGCGYKQPLLSDQKWSFELNSLVATAMGQGVFAVLHALATLANQSRTCFCFAPSLNLHRNEFQNVWHEIDLACIVDGEFVIGEVKETHFQKEDFDGLIEAALVIHPDRVCIFVPINLARIQASELTDWMKESSEKLRSKGITIELHELPSY